MLNLSYRPLSALLPGCRWVHLYHAFERADKYTDEAAQNDERRSPRVGTPAGKEADPGASAIPATGENPGGFGARLLHL